MLDRYKKYKQTLSGLIVPERVAVKGKRPTAFSLFAGVGGMDLGFIQAGFEVVGANEFEVNASLTYMVNLCSYPVQVHYIEGEKDKDRLNAACEKVIFGKKGKAQSIRQPLDRHPEHSTPFGIYNNATGTGLAGSGWIRHNPQAEPVRNFWFGDIRKLKGKDILDALGMQPGDLDCVMGGPPCQGFSQAGLQNIADPRNNLVYEFGRLIVELQPKTFVMEEVPAIINFMDPDGVPVLDKFAMMISEGGYGKWENIKKGMLMQAGCAAGMKSMRGNSSLKQPPKKKLPKVNTKAESEQLSFGI
jgi:DNA (cytosine-5)-methyltransferase 1